MKVVTVIGARPQFIKAAVVSNAFKKRNIKEILIHTGQHFDSNMSAIFFDEMNIPKPNYQLNINNLSHGAMTGRMIEEIETILVSEKPDLLLVYGDTNSTLAGALAAKKIHIPIAHIEAGLRSFNDKMPEEVNRILTDRISSLLYCPTDSAIKNLKNEGYDNIQSTILKSGDVMQDSANFYSQFVPNQSTIQNKITANNFILCTIHRAENTDDKNKLSEIVKALNTLSRKQKIVLPLHPRTKAKLEHFGLSLEFNTILPVGYLDMVWLLKHCQLVITDSGGLQKEAFFFEKNCVTVRDQTEWVELIDNGFNILAETRQKDILNKVETMSTRTNNFKMNLYGGGNASATIVDHIINYLK